MDRNLPKRLLALVWGAFFLLNFAGQVCAFHTGTAHAGMVGDHGQMAGMPAGHMQHSEHPAHHHSQMPGGSGPCTCPVACGSASLLPTAPASSVVAIEEVLPWLPAFPSAPAPLRRLSPYLLPFPNAPPALV